MVDRTSFANRLRQAGVSFAQASLYYELVSELIRTEFRKQEQERSDRFWSNLFLAGAVLTSTLIALLVLQDK
jgi:hypothetical protein